MLNIIALGIILVAIVLAYTDLLRSTRDVSLSISTSAHRDAAGAPRRTPGVALDLSRGVPVTLHGFDPRHEALVVQLSRVASSNNEDSGFAIQPDARGRGLELLFLDRVLVRLPGVPADSDLDLYLETPSA
ncbi:hypothetical protein [Tropicimonas aquimaris]|uniref:Type II secretion system protein GspC N-terminal domain-containing protein n=1 Tax=Tropicimonas aquimaris TaxID=914152 RepID=A0ABW3IRE6_9RHOB